MAYEGMDPDEVEALGRRINTEATTLGGIITKLDGLVQSMGTNWQGADSTRFHDAYSQQYRTQMATAVRQLETLSQAAISNAGEQRRASS
jgi:WXG100 family type VII secretion target